MITIDQAALDAQMRKFSASIAYKSQFFNRVASSALRIEGNRLAQTLMRETPPKTKSRAAEKIRRDVDRKFDRMALNVTEDQSVLDKYAPQGSKKHGNGDVYWYVWTFRILYGLKSTGDYRSASPDSLKALYRATKLNSRGMINAGMRGRQNVRITQKWLVKRSTVNQLKQLLEENIGRAKAGWAVSWRATGGATGIYNPPDWVTRHLAKGDRFGRCDISRIGDSQVPELTLTNTTVNMGHENMRRIAFNALQSRMSAMPGRIAQMIKHPELVDKEFD